MEISNKEYIEYLESRVFSIKYDVYSRVKKMLDYAEKHPFMQTPAECFVDSLFVKLDEIRKLRKQYYETAIKLEELEEMNDEN